MGEVCPRVSLCNRHLPSLGLRGSLDWAEDVIFFVCKLDGSSSRWCFGEMIYGPGGRFGIRFVWDILDGVVGRFSKVRRHLDYGWVHNISVGLIGMLASLSLIGLEGVDCQHRRDIRRSCHHFPRRSRLRWYGLSRSWCDENRLIGPLGMTIGGYYVIRHKRWVRRHNLWRVGACCRW